MKLEYTSPSNILLFFSNYQDWVKRYIYGETLEENVYLVVGTLVHEFLESFFTIDEEKDCFKSVKEYATQKYNQLINKINFDSKLQEYESNILNFEMINDYLYAYIKNWVEETETTAGQSPFIKIKKNVPSVKELKIEDTELKIKGYIDALWIKSDLYNPKSKTATIVDYKTSKKQFWSNPTHYYIQMMIYAYVISKKYKIDWIAVDYVKYHQKFFYRVTQESLNKIENLIKDYWLELEKIDENSPLEYKCEMKLGDYI